MTTKQKLTYLVAQFKKWIAENYSKEQIDKLLIDDAGYPNWTEIEIFFSELLAKKGIQRLDEEDQTNLLYLIARNWDIGDMVSWLSKTTTLSNLGHLEKSDFIMLAKTISKLEHPEFNDAKSQFVSCFRKFDAITPEIEALLLDFYNDKDDYTKRQALMTLGKFGYSNIRDLIKLSWDWASIDSEYFRMDCLYVMDDYLKDEKLIKEYLVLAENDNSEYLSKYVTELKGKYPLSTQLKNQ